VEILDGTLPKYYSANQMKEYEISGRCSMAEMRHKRNAWQPLKKRDSLEDTGVDGTISKWTLRKQMRTCAGFIWLSLVTSSVVLW